ncbi:MAG: hypothetical protein EOO39_30640, partial [Cytophagaceae bacterium]
MIHVVVRCLAALILAAHTGTLSSNDGRTYAIQWPVRYNQGIMAILCLLSAMVVKQAPAHQLSVDSLLYGDLLLAAGLLSFYAFQRLENGRARWRLLWRMAPFFMVVLVLIISVFTVDFPALYHRYGPDQSTAAIEKASKKIQSNQQVIHQQGQANMVLGSAILQRVATIQPHTVRVESIRKVYIIDYRYKKERDSLQSIIDGLPPRFRRRLLKKQSS